jgi:hypothetical protein
MYLYDLLKDYGTYKIISSQIDDKEDFSLRYVKPCSLKGKYQYFAYGKLCLNLHSVE